MMQLVDVLAKKEGRLPFDCVKRSNKWLLFDENGQRYFL